MSYATVYEASQDETFRGRTMACCWDIANDISNESPSTENHKARIEWAIGVVSGQQKVTQQQLAVIALLNTTIASNPSAATDGDLKYQLVSQIDLLIQMG